MNKKMRKGITKKNNTSSIFFKILVFNIAFITIATLIFQVIFYSVLDKEYIKQYEALNISNTQSIFNNIEQNIITRVARIPENYFSRSNRNSGTTYPIKHYLQNNPQAIVELTGRLDEIFLNYTFIKSLDIYYPDTNSIITNFNNVHYIKDSKEIARYLPWLELYKESGQRATLLKENNLNYPKGESVITYVISLPSYENVEVTIAIHIDKQLLDNYIGTQVGHFMIIDRKGNVIYQKGEYNLEKYLPEIRNTLNTLGFREGKLDFQVIEEKMILTYQFSESIDAIYIQISPKSIFYQDYNTFNNVIKMMCGISIMVSLIGVLLISKRSNKTYGKEAATVMENLDPKEITFDRAIKQISSKIYDLNKKVTSTKNIMLGNEIRNIIEKNISAQAEEIIAKQINYEKLYGCIIKNKGHQEGIDAIKVEALLEHEDSDFKVILVQNKENELYLLIAYNESNYSLTLEWVKEFGEKICDELGIFLIGGSYHVCVKGIIETFKEVKMAREYHYILPDKKWVYYVGIDYKKAKVTKNHLKIFAQIESAIKGNEYPQVKIKIEQLIVAFQSGQYSSHYCKATLRDLVTHINHLSESYQVNSMEAYGYDIRHKFIEIEDIYEFKKWILPICQTLINNIESNKEGIGKELEKKILHIIEQNLENDISLEFLADKINMRADTLSKLFKVMMGKNYSEYIKEKKLKYALKLLMTKQYSVKDIADKLGYSSTQYFIKIFKEEFGETPKQYQKQNSSYMEENI